MWRLTLWQGVFSAAGRSRFAKPFSTCARTVWKMVSTKMELREELEAVYKTLPTMRKSKCHQLCQSGRCDFECCTITGCSAKERKNINNYIREKGLKLPFIKTKHGLGYILPFGDKNAPKCQYIGKNGCMVYEVRPAICRLFGAVKQMPCDFQPLQARFGDYPLEAMVKIGMIPEESYNRNLENGGIELFERILDSQNHTRLGGLTTVMLAIRGIFRSYIWSKPKTSTISSTKLNESNK